MIRSLINTARTSTLFCNLSKSHRNVVNLGVNLSSRAMSTTEYNIVYVTVPSDEVAGKVTNALLDQKLAACVSKIPGLMSTYVWEGKIETSAEQLLMIKTKTALLPTLIQEVKKVHPYEVPEVISVPITAGNPDYLKWIGENTR
eukprot:TRINITY_DN10271_c0_g1_i2.p1 TRINITY_DN10271_c0_g1~~TRINITY_DN10271_c0_g1_i2.p1  ORF type:complete len:144 (+),score=19.46 TRINITY_DN10271_c0_g1_i2:60-491(+)